MVLVSDDEPNEFSLSAEVADPRIRWLTKRFSFLEDVVVSERWQRDGARRNLSRRDKGRKALWASRLALETSASHLMLLDCDDLVSSRLAAWCLEHADSPGWWIETGWLWSEEVHWLIERLNHSFSERCGSSNIVHSRFFDEGILTRSFEDPNMEECGWWLPHAHIKERLRGIDEGYSPLPFRGAVYVRHGANMSGQWRGARVWLRRLLRGRLLTTGIRREFFGQVGSDRSPKA